MQQFNKQLLFHPKFQLFLIILFYFFIKIII